jgi:hypothetical protein
MLKAQEKRWTRKEAARLLGVTENQFHYHLRLGRLGFQARPHVRRCVTLTDLMAAAEFFGVTVDVDEVMRQ